MPTFVDSTVLVAELTAIRSNANEIRLISAYTAGDTYATVATNTLALAAVASADWSIVASGANQVLTSPSGKSAVASASAAGTPDLHLAFIKYDSVTPANSVVLWVTNETSNQPITSGNTVNFPAVSFTANQPTQA